MRPARPPSRAARILGLGLAWALAGCQTVVSPRGERFTGTYGIWFADSTYARAAGDTTEIRVITEPFSPGAFGLRKTLMSLDPEIVGIEPDGKAVARGLGRTHLVASLRDGDGKVLAADTLVATVPFAKVLDLYSSFGNCADVRIVKGAAPGAVYLVNRGLFRSLDYGLTWDSLPSGDSTAFRRGTLAENPFRTRELYWVEPRKRILRSGDGGASWDTALSAYAYGIQGLAFHPGIPDKLFLLATEKDTLRLLESRDAGTSFAKTSDLPGYAAPLSLLFDPRDDRILYLSPTPYRSLDGGRTWGATPLKLEGQSIVHFQVDGKGRLYGSYRTLLRSDDHGESWETLFAPSGTFLSLRDLELRGGDAGVIAFYDPETKSVVYSRNDGYAWDAVSLGAFSPNSCGYSAFSLVRESPLEFLVSDGLYAWRFRPLPD